MLSDEEKKAIEKIKKILYMFPESEELKLLLNLTEKQSKEIEELNKSDESKEQSSMKYYNLYKELVDKIKAKIEELEKLDFGADLVSQFTANLTTITILQSLLEKGK